MKKSTKWIFLGVLAGLLLELTACGLLATGCGDADADVVFVNCTDVPIGSVAVENELGVEGGQNADNSPLGRGDCLGFYDVEAYPLTVTVYAGLNGQGPMASCMIGAEPEGERWYVVARGSGEKVALEVTAIWPLDGQEGG